MKFLMTALCVALMGLATAGCSTFEKRAKERAATFSALDEATRARLEE